MSKVSTFFTLFLAINFSLFGQKSEEKLVRKAFESYKTNILNDKGDQYYWVNSSSVLLNLVVHPKNVKNEYSTVKPHEQLSKTYNSNNQLKMHLMYNSFVKLRYSNDENR